MKQGLSILGSPHKNGNNGQLLTTIINRLEKNKKINFENFDVNDLTIKACSACQYCEKNKGCIIDDDMEKLYKKFDQADLILIASPLYFNSVSAQLKKIIDRCQAIWANKLVLNQPLLNPDKKRLGYFISTAGQANTKDRFKYVTGTIELFFKALNAQYAGNFFVGDVDNEDVINRPAILARAKDFADQIKKTSKKV